MLQLVPLSVNGYQLVFNVLSLTVAFMAGAALLFVLLRPQIAPTYRLSLSLMATAVAMAAYHYWRLLSTWTAAHSFGGGLYAPSGPPFTDTYRYADWLGTVPLLLAATTLVLDIGARKSASLVARLSGAAALMIALGYVGEVSADLAGRAVWGILSTVPFLYILYVVWGELSAGLSIETPRVRALFGNMRWLLLIGWTIHPLIYALPFFVRAGAGVEVSIQLGYSLADLLSKVAYGLLLYAVAREKTLDPKLLTPGDARP